MELPPKIQLPPKTLRQQITGNTAARPAAEKVPLSAARPMPQRNKYTPPVGTVSKPRQEPAQAQVQPAPVLQPIPVVPATLNLRTIQPAAQVTKAASHSPQPAAPGPLPAPAIAAAPQAAPLPQAPVPAPAAAPFIPGVTSARVGGETPVRVSSGSLQKPFDSLPVLSAFQQFLDNEREVMRKRLVVLSVSYLMALLLIVGITIAGGMFMVKRLRGDFQDIRKEVAKLEILSLKNRTDADTLSERISRETTAIRTELIPVTDDIKNRILDKVSRHDDKLGKMDLLVQLLQKENSDLKNNLSLMQTRWLSVTNDMMTTLARIEQIQQSGQSNRKVEQPVISSSSAMMLAITPQGQDRAFAWLMPIPE